MVEKVIQIASRFLNDQLHKQGTVKKVSEVEGGWEVTFEVVEKDNYVATIVPGSTTYSRNIYFIQLDAKLKVVSFENPGQTYAHPKDQKSE